MSAKRRSPQKPLAATASSTLPPATRVLIVTFRSIKATYAIDRPPKCQRVLHGVDALWQVCYGTGAVCYGRIGGLAALPGLTGNTTLALLEAFGRKGFRLDGDGVLY